MSSRPRYVFDTNVVVSALLFDQSAPGQAFYEALDRGEILLSQDVVEELNDVLSREKFDLYLRFDEREQFLNALIREATVVEVTEEVQVCRDPKDDKYLDLAISGGATQIITGDEDLLTLNPFRGVEIVTPAQFLASTVEDRTEGEA